MFKAAKKNRSTADVCGIHLLLVPPIFAASSSTAEQFGNFWFHCLGDAVDQIQRLKYDHSLPQKKCIIRQHFATWI